MKSSVLILLIGCLTGSTLAATSLTISESITEPATQSIVLSTAGSITAENQHFTNQTDKSPEVFMPEITDKLQAILDAQINPKKVLGTSFCVSTGGKVWSGTSGNLHPGEQFFIASTTKLFVTAIIMNMRSQGLLNLDDKISNYLPVNLMQDLHIYKGKDYSGDITIRHLLAHTSGLPDYFQQKNAASVSLETELLQGHDQHWTCEEAVARSKNLKPYFVPGSKDKAHYSDTNFQLLGRIIEVISGKSFSDNCTDLIIKPLALKQTYLYQDAADTRPQVLYYKSRELPIPLAMTSFGPDGGMVSTAEELLFFIRAFFNGAFFPTAYLPEMQVWNKIFFPMQAGVGIHKFQLPGIFDPMRKMPQLIGHSGLSGTLAYGNPAQDIYITGTVNQIAYPSQSFVLAVKLLQQASKKPKKPD